MRFLRKERAGNLSLDTFIGANTVFEGCIHSERSLCVDGSVRGRIEAKGEVVVGREGKVEADIQADSVVVGGQIVGNVTAHRRLEITSTGRVTGDIEAHSMSIAEGGVLDGFCKMLERVETPVRQLELKPAVEGDHPLELKTPAEAAEDLSKA
jgi:cytoskeletal protein CcmA (bactofilin family)